MCCLRLPLIFAAFELALCLRAICDVPLLPHPVAAAVVPVAHSSMCYAYFASISHHAVEQHSERPVYQYAVEAVQVEDQEVAEEEEEEEEEDCE